MGCPPVSSDLGILGRRIRNSRPALGTHKTSEVSLECMRPSVYSGSNNRLVLLVYVIVVIVSAFLIVVKLLCSL